MRRYSTTATLGYNGALRWCIKPRAGACLCFQVGRQGVLCFCTPGSVSTNLYSNVQGHWWRNIWQKSTVVHAMDKQMANWNFNLSIQPSHTTCACQIENIVIFSHLNQNAIQVEWPLFWHRSCMNHRCTNGKLVIVDSCRSTVSWSTVAGFIAGRTLKYNFKLKTF